MGKSILQKEVEELGDIFKEIGGSPDVKKLDPSKIKRANELRYSIIDRLLWSPGQLVTSDKNSDTEWLEIVVNAVWDDLSENEIFDELHSGGYSGLLSFQMDTFSKRVKMLKPTFINKKASINKEFRTFYQEAMKCWLYGLNNAAIMLSHSILEDNIRNQLCLLPNREYAFTLIDPKTFKSNKKEGMGKLVGYVKKEKLLPSNLIKDVEYISEARNNAIHNLDDVNDEDAYDIITKTKFIVEFFLTEKK